MSSSVSTEMQYLTRFDPLFHALAQSLGDKFVRALVEGFVGRITKVPTNKFKAAARANTSRSESTEPDPRPSALAWVRHLVNDAGWLHIMHTQVPLRLLAEPCVQNPGPYSTMLGVVLVKSRLWEATSHSRKRKREEIEGVRGSEQKTKSSEGDEAVRALTDAIRAALNEKGKEENDERNAGDRVELVEEHGFGEASEAMGNTEDSGMISTAIGKEQADLPVWAGCSAPIGVVPR
jgi:hypothetical protein